MQGFPTLKFFGRGRDPSKASAVKCVGFSATALELLSSGQPAAARTRPCAKPLACPALLYYSTPTALNRHPLPQL